MNPNKIIKIRCRAIILHEGRLLLVRHTDNVTFNSLPGGHLEWGEGIKKCMEREIVEELGVTPNIGRLLYINNFIDENDTQSVEFFFEIINGSEYLGCEKLIRSHSHELKEIIWADPSQNIKILPKQIEDDFINSKLISDHTRFIL